ncbi:MAG: hypothetical protein FJX80_14665 [Bacteroidetes bacterium]|nr:hypothetical protein [Bacteroidota bacterium]
MKKTLEKLKYRIENNKYFTADHIRAVIREVGELNEEDHTVAHLLKVAETSGWLGKADEAGFYPSLIARSTQSSRLGGNQENRIWLMASVPSSKIKR